MTLNDILNLLSALAAAGALAIGGAIVYLLRDELAAGTANLHAKATTRHRTHRPPARHAKHTPKPALRLTITIPNPTQVLARSTTITDTGSTPVIAR